MVDIFHSIINEWAKFDTKDVFSFINKPIGASPGRDEKVYRNLY